MRNTSGVVLIQIRDRLKERRRVDRVEARSGFYKGLSWLLDPLKAILTARLSTAAFRNDEQLERLRHAFAAATSAANPAGQGPFFTSVVFEFDSQAPLSWYLSSEERANIEGNMEEGANPGARRWLEKWWQH